MSRKKRRQFTPEFRREMVRLLEESGRPVREVTEEFDLPKNALWRWRQKYGRAEAAALPPSEAEELRRLRRENEILRQERDFLKKATAYFAQPPQ